jgi:hypothetical protein
MSFSYGHGCEEIGDDKITLCFLHHIPVADSMVIDSDLQ